MKRRIFRGLLPRDHNSTLWSRGNNLKVNPTKYAEIIFVHNKRKAAVHTTTANAEYRRTCLNYESYWELVNTLSVSEHVQTVIGACARTLYALKLLRVHGVDDTALHDSIYRSVIIAKLTYASSAWCGFTSAAGRQRLYAFIGRSERSRFVQPNQLLFAELCHTADERLFSQILANKTHVLNNLLLAPSVV